MSAQVHVARTNLGGGKTLACQLVDLVLHVIGCVQVLEPLRSREREREGAMSSDECACEHATVGRASRCTTQRSHTQSTCGARTCA
jgi:hypothetical protein